MNRFDRRARHYRASTESLEARTVLSQTAPYVELLHNVLFGTLGSQPSRPNTPVAPFAATSNPTFFDPSGSIIAGNRMAFGTRDYVAPFAKLDARNGFIEVGSSTTIQDNATLIANPAKNTGGPGLILGDNVLIGAGATVIGPGQIGSPGGAAVSIGANAIIDRASVQAGAQVGALATVEPGVAILAGYRVLSGADVKTEAEATNPALGKVVIMTGADPILAQILTDNATLATGYTALYQGNSATGASPGTTATNVFNGSLAPVEGASQNPGAATVSFETAASPRFATFAGRLRVYTSPFYRSRVIGAVTFTNNDPFTVERLVGRQTSIRGDEDQPITIGALGRIGDSVTIHGYRGGRITAGSNLILGTGAVLAATSAGNLVIGNAVSIGDHAVVNGSTIGTGANIGAFSSISNSTVPPGATIAPGTVLVNNRVVGQVGF